MTGWRRPGCVEMRAALRVGASLVMMGTWLDSAPAAAQSPTGNQLLNAEEAGGRRQSVTMLISLYGTNGAGSNDGSDGEAETSLPGMDVGSSAEARGRLAYGRRGRHSSLGAAVMSAAQYRPGSNQVSTVEHVVDVAFSHSGRRTSFQSAQRASYSPFRSFSAFQPGHAGAAAGSQADYAAATRPAYTYESTIGVSRPLARRVSLSLSQAARYTEIPGADLDFLTGTVGGRLHLQMTRQGGLRLGYELTKTGYESPAGTRWTSNHNIDIGIDYRRGFEQGLALSRRTTISFGSGSGIVTRQQESRFQLVGQAAVTHSFARTWTGRVQYSRGFQFVDALVEPLFSDAIQASVEGRLGRRASVIATAAASAGEAGSSSREPDNGGSGFDAYTASVNFRATLTRRLALAAQYRLNQYAFQEGVQLAQGHPRELDRHRLQVGMMLSVPIR
jgi:hypothetical protein